MPVTKKRSTKSVDTVIETPVVYEMPAPRHAPLNWTPLLMIVLLIASFFLGVSATKLGFTGGGATNVLAAEGQGQTAPKDYAPTPTSGPVDVALGNITMGDKNAKVQIVEFSDFQCLFCRALWRDTLAQIKTAYVDTGKASFSFRHYPIPELHPSAYVSAQAAECARAQGKFWEFHDKIFEKQQAQGDGTIPYTKDDIIAWAGEIPGLDATALTACLNTTKYDSLINKDIADAQKAGVTGTPAIFVNGKIVVGAQKFPVFQQLIDAELAKQ